jgi:hypothetical protein
MTKRVECHLIRRDMEYRLSVRSGKDRCSQETHRTPTAAAERAENLRRRAIEGQLLATPTATTSQTIPNRPAESTHDPIHRPSHDDCRSLRAL